MGRQRGGKIDSKTNRDKVREREMERQGDREKATNTQRERERLEERDINS